MGDLINTDINKNLSLAYDDEFNHKYNRANKLNKEISVKDKIIDINENSSRHQNKNIKILKLELIEEEKKLKEVEEFLNNLDNIKD